MNLLQTVLHYASATPVEADTSGTVSLIFSAAISGTVISALVGGVIQYLINRRNSKIAEKKNTVDAESDIITRYKEAAAEERSQKESSVATIKSLLHVTESEVISLRETIKTLNETLTIIRATADYQGELVKKLTQERDRVLKALEKAEAEIARQRENLAQSEKKISGLTSRTPK